MLFEYGTAPFFRGSTEQVNSSFIAACDNKDIRTLEIICAGREIELLDAETVSTYASLSIRDDSVEVLSFMFKHFPRVDLDVVDFLGTSVSHDARQCFSYLLNNQNASIDTLKYYDIYDAALQMQGELSLEKNSMPKGLGSPTF